MPRPIPGWLYILIGLAIVIIVGGVVFFSGRASSQTTQTITATTIPRLSLTPTFTPTATTQANVIAPSPTAVTSNKTVFLIMMENHNWSDIKNSPSAPYINHTILPMASYAEQYYNPPGNHPSEPNYLWLEAGTNFGISNDANPDVNHQSTKQHLITLLNNAHISWKSYQESISGSVCPLTGNNLYAPKHNPMVFFDDVTNNNNPNSAYCIAHVRPYSELANDLRQNTEARYNFITPNICNDMHDSCAPLYDPVKQGDTWLAQNIPMILNSQAYKNGGIIFITWDEGEGGDGPIGMIVLSPDAKGGGYSNTIHYTHSSTLRTLEEIFGVTPLLGDAANATDLRDLFKTQGNPI
jgi:phosphatidylinositol-3-phosphatase